MALKQRKQITGTTEQINQYAGVEGQLVWDKSAKTLVGMSGTAGKNYPLAPKAYVDNEVSKVNSEATKKADKTYVDQQLAKKQPIGDYATNTALTQGLAGKANSSHTHTKSQITDFPAIPDTSTLIPKSGARGNLAGYETTNTGVSMGRGITINRNSPDSQYYELEGITDAINVINVEDGATGETWTKTVYIANGSVGLASKWKWVGGNAPTMKFPGVLVLHWNNAGGIANYVGGVS